MTRDVVPSGGWTGALGSRTTWPQAPRRRRGQPTVAGRDAFGIARLHRPAPPVSMARPGVAAGGHKPGGRWMLKNVRDQRAGLLDHAEPRAPPRLDRGPRRHHPPCRVVWRRLVTDVATPECSTHDRHESQRIPGCTPVGVWPRVLLPGEDAPESPH